MRSAATMATAALLASALGACAPTPPPEPPRTVAPPRSRPRSAVDSDPLVTGPTGFFRSKRFNLRIPFPDGATFKIDDTRGPWLTAKHEASRSTLVVRRWRETELTNHETCEVKARSLRALPSIDDGEVIGTPTVAVPPDHDTHATIALVHAKARKDQAPPPLYGVILAFGGYAHDCFAYAFVTEATGPDAEDLVAARLARMFDGSLQRIEARSDLDPRLERDAAGR